MAFEQPIARVPIGLHLTLHGHASGPGGRIHLAPRPHSCGIMAKDRYRSGMGRRSPCMTEERNMSRNNTISMMLAAVTEP